MSRTAEDFAYERGTLDAAHNQNEAGRDAFVAVAHTALFAASVSFVGDVAPLNQAIWLPVLIAGWAASIIGLFALTISFGAARRAIDARRAALNEDNPPNSSLCDVLNAISLWSFPVSLLCLFSFVTANVVHENGRQTDPTVVPRLEQGTFAPAAGALPQPQRSVECDSSTSRPGNTTSCAEEVASHAPDWYLAYKSTLEIAADWAAILTALVAVIVASRFYLEKRARQRALEKYLRDKKASPDGLDRYTVMHLMANLAMTEAEVLHAGFRSKKVKAVPGEDKQGRAVRIYFQYSEGEVPKPRKP